MKNGIYQKGIDLRIVAYDLDDNLIVMITTDQHPNEPMILTGDNAANLIEDLVKHMEPAVEES